MFIVVLAQVTRREQDGEGRITRCRSATGLKYSIYSAFFDPRTESGQIEFKVKEREPGHVRVCRRL
jgi:hypothetical protein